MKFFPLSLLAVSALACTPSAFAISDSDLAEKCLDVGKAKIAAVADAAGCAVDLGKVEVEGVDNRWYNPSKYVWYQVQGECGSYDRLIKLVQYYEGRCF